MTLIEIIVLIACSTGFAALVKFLYGKIISYYKEKKRLTDRQFSINSFRNSELIFQELVSIGQEFDCSYTHLVLIHNGGKAMNELTEKALTVRMEYKDTACLDRIKPSWNNREIDSHWFKLLNEVVQGDFLHIEDITKHTTTIEGVRLMYNIDHGKEFYISKLDWIGDTLVVLILQRKNGNTPLSTKEKAFIKYRADAISKLFVGARHFLDTIK